MIIPKKKKKNMILHTTIQLLLLPLQYTNFTWVLIRPSVVKGQSIV